MTTHLTRERLRAIARDERAAYTPTSTNSWPDCFDVSEAIRTRLLEEYDIDEAAVEVREFYPADGFRHYALILENSIAGESLVLDASFDQFATETETPVNLAPAAEISNIVIVSPKQRYLFF